MVDGLLVQRYVGVSVYWLLVIGYWLLVIDANDGLKVGY